MRLGRWAIPEEPSIDRLFSMHALRRAWQQVRRSGKSPGTDEVTPVMFEANLNTELNRLRQQLMNRTYHAQPLRRYYARKASGKERPISIWAIRDRVVQRAVTDYLMPHLDAQFLDCSYGYRPGRSVEDAVKAITKARDGGQRWVLETDIHDCFGSVNLDLLMGQIAAEVSNGQVRDLIESWLNTPVKGHPHQIAGVSQGGVISPLLANLYLHRFDQMMTAALPHVTLVRFADDFIVLSRTEEEATWSLDVARRSLENLRLALNIRKTRVIHFDESFTFVGVQFRGDVYHTKPVQSDGEEET